VRPRRPADAAGRPLSFTVRRHVAIAFFTLLYFAVTGLTLLGVIVCLRTGVMGVRVGNRQISRRENPILFWVGITPAIGALVLEICFGLWIAYQFWSEWSGWRDA
jgi:hypothetical protein